VPGPSSVYSAADSVPWPAVLPRLHRLLDATVDAERACRHGCAGVQSGEHFLGRFTGLRQLQASARLCRRAWVEAGYGRAWAAVMLLPNARRGLEPCPGGAVACAVPGGVEEAALEVPPVGKVPSVYGACKVNDQVEATGFTVIGWRGFRSWYC
jgi:hypothetical protein